MRRNCTVSNLRSLHTAANARRRPAAPKVHFLAMENDQVSRDACEVYGERDLSGFRDPRVSSSTFTSPASARRPVSSHITLTKLNGCERDPRPSYHLQGPRFGPDQRCRRRRRWSRTLHLHYLRALRPGPCHGRERRLPEPFGDQGRPCVTFHTVSLLKG